MENRGSWANGATQLLAILDTQSSILGNPEVKDGDNTSRHTLQLAPADQAPGLHCSSGYRTRAGHRRQHCNLQRRERRSAASLALQRSGPTGDGLEPKTLASGSGWLG